jgi:hypothetical protein
VRVQKLAKDIGTSLEMEIHHALRDELVEERPFRAVFRCRRKWALALVIQGGGIRAREMRILYRQNSFPPALKRVF